MAVAASGPAITAGTALRRTASTSDMTAAANERPNTPRMSGNGGDSIRRLASSATYALVGRWIFGRVPGTRRPESMTDSASRCASADRCRSCW